MPIAVAQIYRFPVKGLAPEGLEAVTLAVAEGLPYDRHFAVARGDSHLDPATPRWRPKQWFVMLMRDAQLARVTCRLDEAARTIELRAPDKPVCAARFDDVDGRRQLEAYINNLLGVRREGTAYWMEAGDVSFTDVPQNCVSLINLESVRDLAARMRTDIHPLRFRANIYLSGAEPWSEFDWVGHDIEMGGIRLHIPSRIPRCAATAVNPETGERDVNVVKGLLAAYGHYDMGIYGEVLNPGRVQVGDAVIPPGDAAPRSWSSHWLRFFGFLTRSAPIVLRQR